MCIKLVSIKELCCILLGNLFESYDDARTYEPQIFSEIFLIVRGTERVAFKNMYWSSRNVLVILVRFYSNLTFVNRFSKNTEISNFMKIRRAEAELFTFRRKDGRTDGQT